MPPRSSLPDPLRVALAQGQGVQCCHVHGPFGGAQAEDQKYRIASEPALPSRLSAFPRSSQTVTQRGWGLPSHLWPAPQSPNRDCQLLPADISRILTLFSRGCLPESAVTA